MKLPVLTILTLLSITAMAQEQKKIEFALLAQNDDYAFLMMKENKNKYEKIKMLPLDSNITLSFGGSYRFQAEGFSNMQFVENNDELWLLHRVLLHSHLKFKNKLEVFAELISSTVTSKDNLSPVDMDVLAFNQFFVGYNFTKELKLTMGRQNLIFGSRRLIDLREGPNVRRSFDLLRMDYVKTNTAITTLFALSVKNIEGVFDNNSLDFQETLSGFYLTKNYSKKTNFDLYYLFQKNDNVTYNSISENERRSSVGIRYFGNFGKLDFDTEGVYQFGRLGDKQISAYTLSVKAYYTFKLSNVNTGVGVKTELISGDKNPADNKQETFDALYPRGAYFGRVAQFGPANLIDFHPFLNFSLKNFYAELDYVAFWRSSNNDAVYSAALLPEYQSESESYFIGNQWGLLLGYSASNHLNFELESNVIFPGPFLKESKLGQTLGHLVFTAEFKF